MISTCTTGNLLFFHVFFYFLLPCSVVCPLGEFSQLCIPVGHLKCTAHDKTRACLLCVWINNKTWKCLDAFRMFFLSSFQIKMLLFLGRKLHNLIQLFFKWKTATHNLGTSDLVQGVCIIEKWSLRFFFRTSVKQHTWRSGFGPRQGTSLSLFILSPENSFPQSDWKKAKSYYWCILSQHCVIFNKYA